MTEAGLRIEVADIGWMWRVLEDGVPRDDVFEVGISVTATGVPEAHLLVIGPEPGAEKAEWVDVATGKLAVHQESWAVVKLGAAAPELESR